jgi:uncharacterized Zn-finger protein
MSLVKNPPSPGSRAHQNPFEVVHVDSKKVTCFGSVLASGASSKHPLVYLNMGEKDFVVCPYCSKTFTTRKQGSVMFGLQTQLKQDERHNG